MAFNGLLDSSIHCFEIQLAGKTQPEDTRHRIFRAVVKKHVLFEWSKLQWWQHWMGVRFCLLRFRMLVDARQNMPTQPYAIEFAGLCLWQFQSPDCTGQGILCPGEATVH